MPKQRSPERIKAQELYLQRNGNILLSEIAKQIGLPESTIRGWKSKDKWDACLERSDKNMERSNQNTERSNQNTERSNQNEKNASYLNSKDGNREKQVQKQKSKTNSNTKISSSKINNKNAAGNKGGTGAPKNNQNSVGNRGGPGAPLRNKRAVTTGEYETIYYDCLSEDEKKLVSYDDFFSDKYAMQKALNRDITIREYRMLKRIKDIEETPGGMILESITKNKGTHTTKSDNQSCDQECNDECSQANTDFETNHGKIKDKVQTQDTSSHIAKPVIKRVLEIEESLTRIEAQKQRAIMQMHRMEIDDKRISIDMERAERERNKPTGKTTETPAFAAEHSMALSKIDSILDKDDPTIHDLYQKLFDGYNNANDAYDDELP